jgi:hypothetical protein
VRGVNSETDRCRARMSTQRGSSEAPLLLQVQDGLCCTQQEVKRDRRSVERAPSDGYLNAEEEGTRVQSISGMMWECVTAGFNSEKIKI